MLNKIPKAFLTKGGLNVWLQRLVITVKLTDLTSKEIHLASPFTRYEAEK